MAATSRAFVAIVERTWDDAPWRAGLTAVVVRHSANRDYRPYDLFAELAGRRLFRIVGRREIAGEVESTVDTVLEGLHSQNGLSRHALGPAGTAGFDAEARASLAPFTVEGRLRVPAGAIVTWGTPT